MRLFIGIRISDEIKIKLALLQKKLKEKVKEAKIVNPDNLHLTLKFLGEVRDDGVSRISEVLENISFQFSPFSIRIGGIGRFPDGKKIRVLWVGAEAGNHLRQLNKFIEEKFEKIGFLQENRFKEHITISRFKSKSISNISFIDELERKYMEEKWGEINVETFELIQSYLKPMTPNSQFYCSASPIYVTVKKFNLGGGDG